MIEASHDCIVVARLDGTILLANSQIEKITGFPSEQFIGNKGRRVSLPESLEGCEKILNDEFASYSEQSLYMIGSIEEAKEEDKKEAKND